MLSLLLDPDPEPRYGIWEAWRREMHLPPCRLVWVGAVVESPDSSATPHIEALVAPTETPESGRLTRVTFPMIALSLLIVGRVLKEKSGNELPEGIRRSFFGGPTPEPSFSRFEWLIDAVFSPDSVSVVTVDEVAAFEIGRLAGHPIVQNSPLCLVKGGASRKLVLIPCWELFRFYYAHGPLVASLLFDFPRWKPETAGRLLRTFDGHRFQRGRWSQTPPAPGQDYAAARLTAVVRDAAVSFASTGRAQLRAIPPFEGPATLRCVGIPFSMQAGRRCSCSRSSARVRDRNGGFPGDSSMSTCRPSGSPTFRRRSIERLRDVSLSLRRGRAKPDTCG